jgi:hypothetical protein
MLGELLITKHFDEISWYELSQNPNAIHFLEQNLDKVNWSWLCQNPNIFENQMDYFLK